MAKEGQLSCLPKQSRAMTDFGYIKCSWDAVWAKALGYSTCAWLEDSASPFQPTFSTKRLKA